MKKISCDIIRDILPLYLDDVVSDDTKELVEEHLAVCDSCKAEADILRQNISLPISRNIKLSDARVVKNLKSRLLRKKVVVSIISVVVSIAVVMGIYAFMALTESVIPYDSANIHVEEKDGEIYASYYGNNLAGMAGVGEHTVVIDGVEKNVVIFSYYETLWTKYVGAIFDRSQEERGIYGMGDSTRIDQVYYAEFNLRAYLHTTPPAQEWDYEYMIERSKLVWSK